MDSEAALRSDRLGWVRDTDAQRFVVARGAVLDHQIDVLIEQIPGAYQFLGGFAHMGRVILLTIASPGKRGARILRVSVRIGGGEESRQAQDHLCISRIATLRVLRVPSGVGPDWYGQVRQPHARTLFEIVVYVGYEGWVGVAADRGIQADSSVGTRANVEGVYGLRSRRIDRFDPGQNNESSEHSVSRDGAPVIETGVTRGCRVPHHRGPNPSRLTNAARKSAEAMTTFAP